jgi:hypothetical protein
MVPSVHDGLSPVQRNHYHGKLGEICSYWYDLYYNNNDHPYPLFDPTNDEVPESTCIPSNVLTPEIFHAQNNHYLKNGFINKDQYLINLYDFHRANNLHMDRNTINDSYNF